MLCLRCGKVIVPEECFLCDSDVEPEVKKDPLDDDLVFCRLCICKRAWKQFWKC